MKIQITEAEHKFFDDNEELIINGEEFNFIAEEDSEMNDNGKTSYYIYQQPSTNKFFRVSVKLMRLNLKK